MADENDRSTTGPWEVLEIVGTEEDAAVVAGYLRSQGVPCEVESMHSHEFPVNVTALGNVRIEVPGEHLERARDLLAERDAAPPPELLED